MQQHHILVADDDLDILGTLVKALTEVGFVVDAADNGQDAYTKAISKKPELIIIDEMMPGLTGIQVIEEIRKDEWGAKVPVIVLTNVENNNQINNALKLGVSDYLVKADLHIPQIVKIINDKLN